MIKENKNTNFKINSAVQLLQHNENTVSEVSA